MQMQKHNFMHVLNEEVEKNPELARKILRLAGKILKPGGKAPDSECFNFDLQLLQASAASKEGLS